MAERKSKFSEGKRNIIARLLEVYDIESAQLFRMHCCHIDSVARELFNNKTPFELMESKAYKKLLDSLDLSSIPPDEVCLKPVLLKH